MTSFVGWIDADDGVPPSIGEPRCSIRPYDDTLRRGILAKRDAFDLTCSRIEPAGNAGVLTSVPNLSRGTSGDVVRIVALRHFVVLGFLGTPGRRQECQQCGNE